LLQKVKLLEFQKAKQQHEAEQAAITAKKAAERKKRKQREAENKEKRKLQKIAPAFANDGSFLEMAAKLLAEQNKIAENNTALAQQSNSDSTSALTSNSASSVHIEEQKINPNDNEVSTEKASNDDSEVQSVEDKKEIRTIHSNSDRAAAK
jgi:hypothetical protein